jgi:sugar/nucleoside kinase (ribokinase family)
MSASFDVVVAGHICLDVLPDLSNSAGKSFAEIFRPGRLVQVGPVAFTAGGPVSNTGLALHRLGVGVQLMGKVGADAFGDAIRARISVFDPHLADGMVVDPNANTSYTVVINPPGIDRIFFHYPGANDNFYAADIRYDVVAQARHFHFGYPPIMRSMYADDGAELAAIFRRAKAAGVATSLDMSLPDPNSASGRVDWRRILARALPFVDIFMPSGEELLFMLRRSHYDELHQTFGGDPLAWFTPDLLSDLGQELLDLGVKVAVVKLGHRGLYLRTGDAAAIATLGRATPSDVPGWANQELWTPAFRANEVGATGSGDSAIAGFLAALLRGLPADETAIMATAVGACNVEAADALSGIRTWEETRARVAAGWAKHDLQIESPGWRFDETRQLWRRIRV